MNIRNIKGIDLNSKPLKLFSNRFRLKTILRIFYSNLDIYSNSIPIEADKCNLETFNTTTNFAQQFSTISLQNLKYPNVWCPYFFKDFDLIRLYFFEIINSFLIRNRLNFYQLNSSQVILRNLNF